MPTLTPHSTALHTFALARDGVEAIASAVSDAAPSGRLHVISDTNVGPRYAAPLVTALAASGRETQLDTFEAGEASKHLETVQSLWSNLLSRPIDRNDTVVACGWRCGR